MEIKLNLLILGVIVMVWAGLIHGDPVSALDPEAPETAELAQLEDEFALDPSDPEVARQLLEAYLDANRPGLAVAAAYSAPAHLREHPMVAHRLSQAFERSGSMLDALQIADLAANRCARSYGMRNASRTTAVPRYRCGARQFALLDMHRSALQRMVEWGVATPTDPRTALAYEISMRRVAIASTQ